MCGGNLEKQAQPLGNLCFKESPGMFNIIVFIIGNYPRYLLLSLTAENPMVICVAAP